jgi:hypothetical protein
MQMLRKAQGEAAKQLFGQLTSATLLFVRVHLCAFTGVTQDAPHTRVHRPWLLSHGHCLASSPLSPTQAAVPRGPQSLQVSAIHDWSL